MAKLGASLLNVSTDFKPIEPGNYVFEIKEVVEYENKGKFANLDDDEIIAMMPKSEVQDEGDMQGRVFTHYCGFYTKEGEPNERGLSDYKRYFETVLGKERVAGFTSGEDFDKDLLVSGQFRGQLVIDSYTKPGETEPRVNNKLKRMEPLS